jgi:hypothetical protein
MKHCLLFFYKVVFEVKRSYWTTQLEVVGDVQGREDAGPVSSPSL